MISSGWGIRWQTERRQQLLAQQAGRMYMPGRVVSMVDFDEGDLVGFYAEDAVVADGADAAVEREPEDLGWRDGVIEEGLGWGNSAIGELSDEFPLVCFEHKTLKEDVWAVEQGWGWGWQQNAAGKAMWSVFDGFQDEVRGDEGSGMFRDGVDFGGGDKEEAIGGK